ncbi:MAG: N-acetylneuraminate synthase family protein [bacterium]
MLTNKDIFKKKPLVIIGPCAIESSKQLEMIAKEIAKRKLSFIRAGIFKLRTKYPSFQGLGKSGFSLLSRVCQKYNLKSVSEITSSEQLDFFKKYIDIIQVGTRNMFNYELLKALSKVKKPIILKRGFSATIEEFIEASKYLSSKNKNIILCLRGIRTFEYGNSCFRNTPDLASILELKEKTDWPIIFDPSHATGDSKFVLPVSRAALSLGADGLLIETHNNPKKAFCDGQQSIDIKQIDDLLDLIGYKL